MKKLRKMACICAISIAATGVLSQMPQKNQPTTAYAWYGYYDDYIWDENEIVEYGISKDNGNANVCNCRDWFEGEVVILSEINGFPVTKIDSDAFEECEMSALVVPDSITSVEKSAFIDCDSLKSLVLGSGINLDNIYNLPIYSPVLESIQVSKKPLI